MRTKGEGKEEGHLLQIRWQPNEPRLRAPKAQAVSTGSSITKLGIINPYELLFSLPGNIVNHKRLSLSLGNINKLVVVVTVGQSKQLDEK